MLATRCHAVQVGDRVCRNFPSVARAGRLNTMPKISAATVPEHREKVLASLVDAAESIMRTEGVETLTAGKVSQAAGIARNSLYRYVDSVGDLRGLVMARHLPTWLAVVNEALAGVEDPRERILVWARVNLEQASASGHGWLIAVAENTPVAQPSTKEVDRAHTDLSGLVMGAWRHLAPDRAELLTAMSNALVSAGFKQLDSGIPLADVTDVVLATLDALVASRSVRS